MNYNKIKEEIKRKNFNENFFIPENTKLGVQGFNKAIKNKTLKVEDLISISKGLSLPVAYWFKEEDQIINSEVEITYGESPATIIKRLNSTIDALLKGTEKLNKEVDNLMQKLEGKSVNRKATG